MRVQSRYELIEPLRPDLGPARAVILTPKALAFVSELALRFRDRVRERLEARQARQVLLDKGDTFDFLPETRDIREGSWRVAPVPADLQDRRVEITGPTERKLVINALNSGACCFMADFEDATTPSWRNLVRGQHNLYGAVRGQLEYDDPLTAKQYRLRENHAVLFVRPRGWHLREHHLRVDGEPVPAALFDFGLYFFHNAMHLLEQGSGPYFYLPKLESHLEARLWNDVFVYAQQALSIPQGSIKATVLIETLPAAFEMHEILYELRDHSAGLNCGRWDYIFSFIKRFRAHPVCIMPDRQQITMSQAFMRAYTQLSIQTCHRREVHAIGGMAAQLPIKDDAEANREAFARVHADKMREVQDGHDGTWVAHPALVPLALEVFDRHMPAANQIACKREDLYVTCEDLLEVPQGTRTEAGLRYSIRVAIHYLAAWLGGAGAVPIYHLMEDAATAEISRAQIWQWLHHHVNLEGALLDERRLCACINEEVHQLRRELVNSPTLLLHLAAARNIFEHLCLDPQFEEFLTIPAYRKLLESEGIPAAIQ